MSFRSNTPKVTKITFGEIKFLFGVIIITSGEAQVKLLCTFDVTNVEAPIVDI